MEAIRGKTKISIPFQVYFKVNILQNLKRTLQLGIGCLAFKLLRHANMYEKKCGSEKRKFDGPLSKEQIDEITSFQVKKVGVNHPRYSAKHAFSEEVIMNPPTDILFYKVKALTLLNKVLQKNQDQIKCAVNIGARVDTFFSYLAPKFSKITFVSVDFQPNLQEHNSLLPQSENWKFMTGYPLDVLRERLKPDLIFMNSTSVLFNSKEFDMYLDEFAESAKFIVINERWYPVQNIFKFFRTIPPEKISLDNPYCAGKHFNYQHNYINKFEQRGYEITSEILPLKNYPCYVLQIVAENQNLRET